MNCTWSSEFMFACMEAIRRQNNPTLCAWLALDTLLPCLILVSTLCLSLRSKFSAHLVSFAVELMAAMRIQMPTLPQYSNAIAFQMRSPLLSLRADVVFLPFLTFGAAKLWIACGTRSSSISSSGVSTLSPSSSMMYLPSPTTMGRLSSFSCSSSSLSSSSTSLFEMLSGCGCGATAGPSLRLAYLLLMVGHEEWK